MNTPSYQDIHGTCHLFLFVFVIFLLKEWHFVFYHKSRLSNGLSFYFIISNFLRPKGISERYNSRSSRAGGTRMTGVGQSRKDANTLMRTKKLRHFSRVISPNIALVDTDSNITHPHSFTKRSLSIATWNVRTLVKTSSKLFEQSEIISVCCLDLLCITETHMLAHGSPTIRER